MVSHATSKRLSGPGLRTFGRVCDRWGLTERERRLVLGTPSRKTCRLWMRRARAQIPIVLGRATLARISAVLAMHAALTVLYDDASDEAGWLRRSNTNPPFNGRSPAAMLFSGDLDFLLAVVRFLKASAAGGYALD